MTASPTAVNSSGPPPVEPNPQRSLAPAADYPVAGPITQAPALGNRALTTLLVLMCLVPVVIIGILQLALPPVKRDVLQAEVTLRNVPPPSYYQLPADARTTFTDAELVVTNTMDVPWTNVNVRINRGFLGNYQIYDHGPPFQPGEQRAYLLDRFVHPRSGARFQVGIVQPTNVEIFAALPDRSRGTFYQNF